APGGGQADASIFFDPSQAVACETLQCRGYGRPGDGKPTGKRGGDYLFSFGLRVRDGLQVILPGDRHGWRTQAILTARVKYRVKPAQLTMVNTKYIPYYPKVKCKPQDIAPKCVRVFLWQFLA